MPRKKRKQAALDAVHDGALGDAHADSSFVVMQREADELVLHIVKWLGPMMDQDRGAQVARPDRQAAEHKAAVGCGTGDGQLLKTLVNVAIKTGTITSVYGRPKQLKAAILADLKAHIVKGVEEGAAGLPCVLRVPRAARPAYAGRYSEGSVEKTDSPQQVCSNGG
jgi:tRNA A58 N-methylase Trm61